MTRDAMRADAARDLVREGRELGGAERAVSTIVGGFLALLGARRGGVLGAALLAIGAYGVHRGVTGRCVVSSGDLHPRTIARAPRAVVAITRGERDDTKSTSPNGQVVRPNGHGRRSGREVS